MALSGSLSKDVGARWKLSISWTATQDISANKSTVTAKMYWESLDQYGAVYAGTSHESGIQHDNGTWSTESATPALNANQKKLVNTYKFDLTHDSDGTKSFSLDGYFDIDINLAGTDYTRINLDEKSFTLNTIPRASKLSDTTPSWTAGSNTTLSITRYSTSFHHEAEVYVGNKSTDTWNWINQVAFSSSQTSLSTSFTTDENEDIFGELNGAASKDTRVVLQTFDSSNNMIGSNTYYGTVTAPSASTGTIGNPANVSIASGQGASTVYIDQSITVNISRANSGFVHTLKFKDGNSGSVVFSVSNVGTSYTWTPTQAQKDALYAKIPNDIEFDGEVEVWTYYNGTKLVRSYTAMDINYRVRNSNPTFGTGYTVTDTNGAANTLKGTGNESYIIQKKSTVKVTIPVASRAKAINGAIMKTYIATLNGVPITKTWSDTADVTFDFGSVDVSTNQTLYIKAIDSRNNSTQTNKVVTIIPYKDPVVVSTAKRANGFDTTTTLTLNGTFSPVTINGANKNSLKYVQYRYKDSKATGAIPTWDTWSNFTYKPLGNTYTADNVSLNSPDGLDTTKTYNVEVKVTDAFSGSTTYPITVGTGTPLMFIDSKLKSAGFGMFPTGAGTVEVNTGVNNNQGVVFKGSQVSGKIWTGTGGMVVQSNDTANLHLGQNNTSDMVFYPDKIQVGNKTVVLPANRYGATGGGIDAQNSDIIGLNNLWMSDTATSSGEAIQWMKSTTPAGSFTAGDWDSFRIYDGTGYLNDKPIFTSDSNQLWSSSGVFLNASQTYPISKAISKCPNGWILVWSRYSSGGINDNWNLTYVPKEMVSLSTGTGIATPIYVTGSTAQGWSMKYFYITDTTVKGNDLNGQAPNNQACLRYVLAY